MPAGPAAAPSPSSTRTDPTRATRTRAWRAAASRSRSAQLLLARRARRPAVGARPRGPRDDRDGRRRRADRRREPGDRPARARAAADGAAAGDRGAAGRGPASIPPRSTSRRSRSPSRRGSTPPGGWARRSRPRGCCSPRTPRRPRPTPTALEAANAGAARPHEARRSPRPERWSPRRADAAGHARARAVARSGSSGSSRRAWPRTAAGRRSSGPSSGDVVRASCRSDGALRPGATLERVRRPLHPPRRARRRGRLRDRRPTAGTTFGDAVPRARRGRGAGGPAPALADRPRPAGPGRRLRPATASSPASRRPAPGTRTRSSPSSA